FAGWTADLASATGAGADMVHVYAYPNPGSGQAPIFLGGVPVGNARGDVAGIYGAQFTNVGYQLTVPAMRAGVYRIVVYAHSTLTDTFNSAYVDVTVQAPGQQMLILSPSAGDTV